MPFERIRGARFACVGVALLLAACGGGAGGDTPTTPPLGMSVNPSAIAFAAPQYGPLPPAQGVQITMSRVDVATVTATFAPSFSAPSWLTSTPTVTGFGANWIMSANVATTTLAPGTYTTMVRVEALSANHSEHAFSDVPVSYTVQPLGSLAASPSGLTFSQLRGAPPVASQSVDISDPDGATSAWSASIIYQSGSGWLSVNAGSTASGPSLPASLGVTVTPPASVGTYSATIRVTWVGPTLDIPVVYTVSDAPITPSQLSLNFSALRLGPAPATQDITLNTQDGVPVAFNGTISYGAGATGWLNAPSSGPAPSVATIGVNTTTLAPGTYTANLTISTASQAFVISVTYVVSEPVVTLSATSLTFSALRLGSVPATQNLTLINPSGVAVPYTTAVTYDAGAAGWLTVPSSDSAPGTFAVVVNTTTLAAGTYSATVRINSAGQSLAIAVSYLVSE